MALAQKKYQTARTLFESLDSPAALFGKGTACYRLQDYKCATAAFSAAAWQAPNDELKARAIFNLANSYFFLGDYDQAAVLYRDAELAGIDSRITELNLDYASSMQGALQRHIKDIRETLRRAQWRAAAGDMPPQLKDLLANGRNLSVRNHIAGNRQQMFQAYKKIFQQQLTHLLGIDQQATSSSSRPWVKTEKVLPQSTAAMMNRLFEMELGIMAPLQQPQAISGKRRW
jgi:tetratricopeptide (TPR) repeat protein